MTDKTLKIILGIIAVNLTIQTVKDVGLFPTAEAQSPIPIEAATQAAIRACWDRGRLEASGNDYIVRTNC